MLLGPFGVRGWAAGLAVFFLTTFPAGGAAVAANIATDVSADCDIRLSGTINEGDAAPFERALTARPGRDWIVACLDSPGGDYFEALNMIRAMLDAGVSVGTRVESGSKCFSACALMFLAGHYGKTDSEPFRRLDATAPLGFHGPYISPDDSAYDPSLAPQAYQAGIQAIGQLLALSRGELFPESLLTLGLEKGFDEFLLINTIDTAGKWQIDVTGYRPPKAIDQRMLFQACANTMEWMAPGFSQDNTTPAKAINLQHGKFRAQYPDFGDEAAWTCVADVFKRPSGEYLVDLQWASGDDDTSIRAANALELAAEAQTQSPLILGKPLWMLYERGLTLQAIAAADSH